MGMDEVRDRMRAFETELEAFQQTLRASMADVQKHSDAVSPLWQDAMRREYDTTWIPLQEAIEDYMRRIGPEQVETLLKKLRHIGAFLDGH
jgi:hypothetical protein